jgi:hypothetical protein
MGLRALTVDAVCVEVAAEEGGEVHAGICS